MAEPPPDVREFLEALPDQTRQALLDLRETVMSVGPDLDERIGYGVPAFYYKKRALVSYGATSKHCALYVQSPKVVEAHRTDLGDFNLSKGTVRFQPDRPIPTDLLRKLIMARMKEIDSR
jgi:uncharacterized protein YdhG (YjbR/CyaY superfamily)